MDGTSRAGRLTLPWAMFAFPFYLWKRSPGKEGSHYDPKCDLFVESEAGLVKTTNAFMLGMLAVLAAAAAERPLAAAAEAAAAAERPAAKSPEEAARSCCCCC